MKKILFALVTLWSLTCCENPIRMETKVHEDGSLSKTIAFEKTEKNRQTQNMFGITQASGWSVQIDSIAGEDDSEKYKIEFKKHFASAKEANAELDKNLDTLFRVNAKFEKSFRWFYTYIHFSETFKPIDRFKIIEPKDYFNLEDSLFLNRLPGEGTSISKADSLFLQHMNEKIFDKYANDALFNEFYLILKDVISQNTTDKKWLDTLSRNKDFIYKKLDDDWGGDATIAFNIADTLGIPLPKEKTIQDFARLSKDINSRIAFMSFARDGKYTNIIEMPWTVVDSNADSTAGNRLFYKPLVTKFAIQPYTMYATSRQLNWWAVFVSVGIALLTGWVLIKFRAKN